jgi:hypothetical protein
MKSSPSGREAHRTDHREGESVVRISSQAILSATVLSLLSGLAAAASKTVDPDKLPKVACSSLRYSKEFLDKYPKAPAACQEARVYKGTTYMKVKGKLYVADKPTLSFAFEDPYGNTLGTVTVKNPKLRVIINGEEMTVDHLKTNQELTFWVPESMFSAQPAAASQ